MKDSQKLLKDQLAKHKILNLRLNIAFIFLLV